MVIMLFGISNVGKTVTGEKLAEKLKYTFLDLDEEKKKAYQTSLEKFMQDNPYPHERYKKKGKILKDLLKEYKDNIVIAVSPIYNARNFNSLLDLEQVIAIELQDTEEHIFERLVFSDENDRIYIDNTYKEKHKDYYMKDIHEDIVYSRRTFKKIKIKYFINNRPVAQVVDELITIIQNNSQKTIDTYIADQPEGVQLLLNQVRDTISAVLPGAQESISWSMPTYWDKHNIIHFAAFKKHIGLYPGEKAIEHFSDRLTEYKDE